MKRRSRFIQIIVFVLVFLLSAPLISSVVAPLSYRAYASELKSEDAYKGLAVTFLLIYFFNKYIVNDGNKSDNSNSDYRSNDPISYSDQDLIWLARGVNGESRGEPFKGQVAVAAVILNRVRSKEFPNTIYGVIHQKKQFSAVSDGQIYLTPTDSSFKAAKEALRGSDPSLGALYFYNPKTATTLWWLETREKTIQIGAHVFAK